MKHAFIAWLLVAVLLVGCVPALAETDEDLSWITQEIWLADNGNTLVFNADGTGVYTSNGKSHEGLWAYSDKAVHFTYEQYGPQELALTAGRSGSDMRLFANGTAYFQKTVVQRKQKEAEEAAANALKAAESKTYKAKWKEEIQLDFMSFSLTDLRVYNAKEQVFKNYPSSFYEVAPEGKQYVAAIGKLTNLTNDWLSLDSIYAEIQLNGKNTYKMQAVFPYSSEATGTYMSNGLEAGATATLALFAEAPKKEVKAFTKARIRLSLYDGLRNGSQEYSQGDFFFQWSVDKAMAAAARKATSAHAKTYFPEQKKLPQPSSYAFVYNNGGTTSAYEETIPGQRKRVSCKYYYFAPQFPNTTREACFNAYVKGLEKAKLTLNKVEEKTDYSTKTIYLISNGKTLLGWAQLEKRTDDQSFMVYVVAK